MALGFFGSVAHPVRSVRMEALHFARAGQLETLLGAGVRLHFWHKHYVFVMEGKDKRLWRIWRSLSFIFLKIFHSPAWRGVFLPVLQGVAQCA